MGSADIVSVAVVVVSGKSGDVVVSVSSNVVVSSTGSGVLTVSVLVPVGWQAATRIAETTANPTGIFLNKLFIMNQLDDKYKVRAIAARTLV